MSKTESTFRSALFGGFNRQDVMDYIGNSSRVAQERIAKLESQNKADKEALNQAQKEVSQTVTQLASVEQELEQVKAELERAQAALEQRESSAEAIETQLTALKEETAKMEQAAAAYALLKDRTATIELEAHQRAGAIEQEALVRANEVRASAEEILCKAQSGYTRLRSDLAQTVTNTAQELSRLDQTLLSVKGEFDTYDEQLTDILNQYRTQEEMEEPEPTQED